MKQTVLITGSSTGVGKATALYFAERNYNVIATMRNPNQGKDLESNSNIVVQQMDVTDVKSVESAIDFGIERFGGIDILINNAGIGVLGTFEPAAERLIQTQFDTNVFGIMRTIKHILPHFRSRKKGMIINISSGVGIIAIPAQSLYDATKYAIEGFSESLYYELAHLGIGVKLVLPGSVKSDFFKSVVETDVTGYPDYQMYQKTVMNKVVKANEKGADPKVIATVIYKAATDGKNKLRYMAGKDIALFSRVRKLLPDGIFMRMVQGTYEK